jgi:HEAT repeat protein
VWGQGTEVARKFDARPPPQRGPTSFGGDTSSMAPVVALEPLKSAVLGLAGAVLSLAIFLLLERTLALLARTRAARREPALTRIIYDALQSSPVSPRRLPRLSRFDRKLVRSILLGLALDLRGETTEAIAALYRQLGFLRRDLRRMKSWRASTRADAAADLGLTHAPEATAALLKAMEDDDVRVRQAAVWAVGQVGTAATLAGVVRLLGDRNLIVAHRALEVLAERGREVADAILTYAETTASRAGRLAAIQLIGWLRLTNGARLLHVFVANLDPEIRVKSVKAAAAIGDPAFLEPFHVCLEDSSWPVRCQAAKGLSLFGSPESVPRLTAALRDSQWWVRFYAAVALAEVGPVGIEALNIALQDPQPAVRDMARYLLERGEVVPALP